MAFLSLESVGKTFAGRGGRPFEALRGVDLSIEEGEFISIIGHSGCGKSTVLNLIAGLLPMTSGNISVNGVGVTGPGPDRMVAFQNHSLLPWLTLRQNIRLAIDQVHKKMSAAERKKLAEDQLDMVKLTQAADRLPGEVSGGMKQRCGIARALCVRPKVLLLDEPFGALDALTRASLQDQLIKIWEKQRITVVMITHDVDEALLLSDRIVMMSNGPAARVAEVMTVDIPRPRDRLKAVDHPSYYRQRGELIYFLNKCKKSKLAPDKSEKAKAPATVSSSGLEKPEITLGFVPLVDCAPFAVAEHEGYFEAEGLTVHLSREPSWRAIADGIREGRLDAAQMVAGMPLSMTLGMGGKAPFAVRTGMTLSRGGNAISFGKELAERGVTTRAALKEKLSEFDKRPVFGMVHPASMHNLLFRSWLAQAGIHPSRDLELTVIPPPQMVANLKRGSIFGYCVGEPWNLRATAEELGYVCATDDDIWPDHPEKVLGVSKEWAEQNPKTHAAVLKALCRACQLAEDAECRSEMLVPLLAERRFVGGEPAEFRSCLVGPYDYGGGETRELARLVRFTDQGSNRVKPQEMHWILAQMARWALVDYPHDPIAVMDDIIDSVAFDALAGKLEGQGALAEPSPIELGSDPPFVTEEAKQYLAAIELKDEVVFEKAKPKADGQSKAAKGKRSAEQQEVSHAAG